MTLILSACAPKVYTPSGNETGNEALDTQVLAVLQEVCGADATEEENLAAVFDWMLSEIGYRATAADTSNGFTKELTEQLALDLLGSRRGSCDSEAALLCVMLERMGCSPVIVQGQFLRSDGSEWVEHAWVIAETAGKTYHFDPLYGRFYAEDHSRDYFMASDETMQKTHSWDASAYPVCG
ncbi:MAG: transglutaminase domain-containing protein [Oscillospiraceae bacterium]|nr:transglutaminase domain-containing protein [Oscillospiraceae bacterium]